MRYKETQNLKIDKQDTGNKECNPSFNRRAKVFSEKQEDEDNYNYMERRAPYREK